MRKLWRKQQNCDCDGVNGTKFKTIRQLGFNRFRTSSIFVLEQGCCYCGECGECGECNLPVTFFCLFLLTFLTSIQSPMHPSATEQYRSMRDLSVHERKDKIHSSSNNNRTKRSIRVQRRCQSTTIVAQHSPTQTGYK